MCVLCVCVDRKSPTSSHTASASLFCPIEVFDQFVSCVLQDQPSSWGELSQLDSVCVRQVQSVFCRRVRILLLGVFFVFSKKAVSAALSMTSKLSSQ